MDGESNDENAELRHEPLLISDSSDAGRVKPTQFIDLDSQDDNSNYQPSKMAFSLASPTAASADTSMAGLSMASVSMGETSSQMQNNDLCSSMDSDTEVMVLKN